MAHENTSHVWKDRLVAVSMTFGISVFCVFKNLTKQTVTFIVKLIFWEHDLPIYGDTVM